MDSLEPLTAALSRDSERALTCEACGLAVSFDPFARTTRAADGSSGAVTFADEALVVWDCPSCGCPQAEDLTE